MNINILYQYIHLYLFRRSIQFPQINNFKKYLFNTQKSTSKNYVYNCNCFIIKILLSFQSEFCCCTTKLFSLSQLRKLRILPLNNISFSQQIVLLIKYNYSI